MKKPTTAQAAAPAKPTGKGSASKMAPKPQSVGAEATGPTVGTTAKAEPAIILFGKDEAGKAHASWFAETDVLLATKAAGLMTFMVLPVTSPEVRAVALQLPAGRVFASGRAFSPFCREAAYEALSGFDGAFQPPPPDPTSTPVVTSMPQRWEDIGLGSLLLATTEGQGDGWFESVVVEDRGEGLFVLRWLDWPELEPFVRRSNDLAMLPALPAGTSTEPEASA